MDANTSLPDIDDSKLSSLARAAVCLAKHVGEGNKFTMNELRKMVPGFTQIDRRVRDLRQHGWIIRAYKDHPGLKPDEYILEKIGSKVWLPGEGTRSSTRISGGLRRTVFERDGHYCLVCGIGAGEDYPDLPGQRARMTLGHLTPKHRGGTDDLNNLRTECARCNEEAKNTTSAPLAVDVVWPRVKELGRKERLVFLNWALAGKRDMGQLERLWMQFRQLPAPQRDELILLLTDTVKTA